MADRIKYLESLVPKDININEKYGASFEKYATYLGNGVYQWNGIVATDTAELFLMGCLRKENIPFKQI